MNTPPNNFKRVEPGKMRKFVSATFRKIGLREDDSVLLGELLVTNDLRGVFSHGTRQTQAYVHHFKEGHLNPQPNVEVISNDTVTMLIDGDGSLGYFASKKLADSLPEKAKEHGVAIGVTRNHGHFGAAGLYSRMITKHDLMAWVTSGVQLHLKPENNNLSAGGGSPHSFAVPAGNEPTFVVDFGAMNEVYGDIGEVLLNIAPGLVFRSLGLGVVCQTFGGILAGLPIDESKAQREWPGANQGSFMLAVDIKRFIGLDVFKAQMDEYWTKARKLKPLPGLLTSQLPGGPEAERELLWAQEGIPVDEEHEATLRDVANQIGTTHPFD